jgi:hypothetical protein
MQGIKLPGVESLSEASELNWLLTSNKGIINFNQLN